MSELRAATWKALEHIVELRDAWARGCITENDGNGGTRSNRNVEVETALRKALLTAPPADVEAELRSTAKRIQDKCIAAGMPFVGRVDAEEIVDMIRPLLRRSSGREDDGVPVDEAWFVSVGASWCESDHGNFVLRLGPLEMYDFPAYTMVALTDADQFEMKTRGDVRRLCAALGVTLTETTNAGTEGE